MAHDDTDQETPQARFVPACAPPASPGGTSQQTQAHRNPESGPDQAKPEEEAEDTLLDAGRNPCEGGASGGEKLAYSETLEMPIPFPPARRHR